MADELEDQDAPKKKGMKMPLLIGLILALIGGGGGYWAVTSGPFATPATEETAEEHDTDHEPDMAPVDTAFVELETLVITLGSEAAGRSLLFTAALEVSPQYQEEVIALTPRVLDVLNSYLRVISISELSEPASLARLRAQMLRRIQVVTGTGRVRDLLVTQFLVN